MHIDKIRINLSYYSPAYYSNFCEYRRIFTQEYKHYMF